MTREEAIEKLEWLRQRVDEETYRAVIMAIKALEQEQDMTIAYLMGKYEDKEPCDDAISREELLKAIDTWDKFGYTETGCFVRITKEIDNYVPYVHLEDVITAIQKLPPVTPSRHVNCEIAEHDGNGCLGYSHYGDDFPIEECLHCPKYTSYEEELRCEDG